MASVVWIVAAVSHESEVLSVTTSTQPAVPSPTPTPTPIPTPRLTPTPKTSPTPVAAATDWKYPNSAPAGDNEWISSDDPKIITDWYKNKINALGLNAKSFVQTSTNGNVLNKLAADNGALSVTVEITKSAADTQTTILVVLDK